MNGLTDRPRRRRPVPTGTYWVTVKSGSVMPFANRKGRGIRLTLVIQDGPYYGREVPIELHEHFVFCDWADADMDVLTDWSEIVDVMGTDLLDLVRNCAAATVKAGGVSATILFIPDQWYGAVFYSLRGIALKPQEAADAV